MSNHIKCGQCNSTYKYLFFLIIFSLLKDLAFGSDNVAIFQYFKILDFKEVSNCAIVRQTLCYFFSIIVGFILYKKESQFIHNEHNKKSVKKLDINEVDRETTFTAEVELIHNEQTIDEYPDQYLIIIIILWVFEEQLLSVYKDVFLHLDFWMIELIIVHHFMKKMLKMKVYSHQRLMLWFCIVPIMLKIATIILSFLDENNCYTKNDVDYQYSKSKDIKKLKLIYIAIPWLSVIVLPYFVLIIYRSYVNTKLKWLMDLKFVSISKIFLFYSIIGFLHSLIVCSISNLIPCGESKNNYTIVDYFCKVKDGNKKYYDNFQVYFYNLFSSSESYKEIIALTLGIPCFILYKFFSLKIIQCMTPVHNIFSFPIFYIFNKSYLLILNYFFSNKKFWYLEVKFAEAKLILDYSSDFFSIIGYLIYLEIIELHFCKFDYNIRRNIENRCLSKSNKTELNISIKSEDSENEKNSSKDESDKEEEKYN